MAVFEKHLLNCTFTLFDCHWVGHKAVYCNAAQFSRYSGTLVTQEIPVTGTEDWNKFNILTSMFCEKY